MSWELNKHILPHLKDTPLEEITPAVLQHSLPNFAPESISTGPVNGNDQISSFNKVKPGHPADPRVSQLAVKIVF
jgi:hypothetical protein